MLISKYQNEDRNEDSRMRGLYKCSHRDFSILNYCSSSTCAYLTAGSVNAKAKTEQEGSFLSNLQLFTVNFRIKMCSVK